MHYKKGDKIWYHFSREEMKPGVFVEYAYDDIVHIRDVNKINKQGYSLARMFPIRESWIYPRTASYKVKGWKKVHEEPEYIAWETKRRNKVYKGQPDKEVVVQRHPRDKKSWTVNYGQAPISMPKYMTRAAAVERAVAYMKMYGDT